MLEKEKMMWMARRQEMYQVVSATCSSVECAAWYGTTQSTVFPFKATINRKLLLLRKK